MNGEFSPKGPIAWGNINVWSIITTIAVGGALWGTTTSRISQMEKDISLNQLVSQENRDQVAELRQAAYGLSYDMKSVKDTVSEIRSEQKSLAMRLIAVPVPTPAPPPK